MRKIFLTALFLIVFIFIPFPTYAKDYSIESVNFEVNINKDGSANIIETRKYNFSGDFTWADEWIPLKGYNITDIEIFDDNLIPLQFEKSLTSDKLYLKWYYKASDEIKTFILKYKIDNAITVHSDISEFYWQLIGDEWTKGTGSVTAKVILPYEANDNNIWAFGHGPLNGKIYIKSTKEVDFSVNNLPAKKFFEV